MTPTPSLLLRDFSDRLSPMVVDARQGLRTRFFTGALMIFHLVLGLLMAGFLFDLNHNDAHEMFWGIIAATLLGVLPLRAFNALHTESKDGTLDMLVLTGISSFRIVWGKWVSLYSQTLLIACSLLPYLIARYQIGGVELVERGSGPGRAGLGISPGDGGPGRHFDPAPAAGSVVDDCRCRHPNHRTRTVHHGSGQQKIDR